MKFNKLYIGLGAMALMFTACDKAADQEYTPAPGVDTPPVYFAYEFTDEVNIDENQVEFTIPVYRANTATAETSDVKIAVSSEATGTPAVGGNTKIFSFEVPNADGGFTKVASTESSDNVTVPVYFPAEAGESTIKVTYNWNDMAANAGKFFDFALSVDGEPSPYFSTTAQVSAVFVPWKNVMGPKGEETGRFIDKLVLSGFSVTGGAFVDGAAVYEVTIQDNEVNPGLYRVVTPYANMVQNDEGEDFRYMGGDIVNYMYINAQDPSNVYLCDRKGNPSPRYDTYYTLAGTYGNIIFWDRVAGQLANQNFEIGGDEYSSAGGAAATFDTQEVNGEVYPNSIIFPEKHFFVSHGDAGDAVVDGDELQIIMPGGKEKQTWEDLGNGMYSEELLYFYENGLTAEYVVPVQRHMEEPTRYRMMNPYTTFYPEPNVQNDDYPIEIDCTKENYVKVPLQETGYSIREGRNTYRIYMTNYAVLYTEYLKEPMSEQQIIKEGLNDIMTGNTISLKNAVMVPVDRSDNFVTDMIFDAEALETNGNKLVLPEPTDTPEGVKGYVSPTAGNTIKPNTGWHLVARPIPTGKIR